MRITCPFCGAREVSEYTYLGDATLTRPEPEAGEAAMYEYVYLRDNSAGAHAEFWYHAAGCRRWLKVTRDTRTHAIEAVEFASP